MKRKGTGITYSVVSIVVIAAIFIIALAMIVSGQNNPFLYANF